MTARREPLAGAELARFTRRQGLKLRLAQRASRKRKSWLDRLATALLARATRPKSAADDFMRDEIVDAEIGFSADELAAYQSGASPPDGASRP